MEKAGAEFQEKQEQERERIKEKYDKQAKDVRIDSKALIQALLKNNKNVSNHPV